MATDAIANAANTTLLGGCGASWNTFETRGVCPRCSWKWIITQCLSCKQFSPHEDWYRDPNEGSDENRNGRTMVENA